MDVYDNDNLWVSACTTTTHTRHTATATTTTTSRANTRDTITERSRCCVHAQTYNMCTTAYTTHSLCAINLLYARVRAHVSMAALRASAYTSIMKSQESNGKWVYAKVRTGRAAAHPMHARHNVLSVYMYTSMFVPHIHLNVRRRRTRRGARARTQRLHNGMMV